MQMVFNLSHSFFLLFDYLLYEKFEDTKGVIRIRKLKKSRQCNGQRKKDKQWITQITKNWVKRTQLETGGELMWSGRVRSSCSINGTRGLYQFYEWKLNQEWSLRRVWRYQRGNIRILKSKKDRQHNDQKKKDKQTNNDLIIHRKQKIEQSEPH